MALSDRGYNKYLAAARRRILADPHDDLHDLALELNNDIYGMTGFYRRLVMREWIVDALFRGDKRAAQKALIRCVMLKPVDSADIKKARDLLYALWQLGSRNVRDCMESLCSELEPIENLADMDLPSV